jgi:hypothetical protein
MIKTYFFNLSPFPLTVFTENQSLYFEYFTMLSSPSVWLCIILCLIAAIIPDVCLRVIENIKETRSFDKLKDSINETIRVKTRTNESSLFKIRKMSSSLTRDHSLNSFKRENKIVSHQVTGLKSF